MGSDHEVGPLFVHPLCGYGEERLCRAPAYPCPPGPLYGPETWSFVSSHGVDGYHRPAPKYGLGVIAWLSTVCVLKPCRSVSPLVGVDFSAPLRVSPFVGMSEPRLG